MKKIKLATRMMQLLIVYYIIYNSIFGWNMLPESDIEALCDKIFSTGIYFAFIIYFLTLFEVYRKFIKKQESKNQNISLPITE